jgi:hypothetical protein
MTKRGIADFKRQLLVYMFEDDFPGEEFNHELLESELLKIAQLYNSSAIELKQQKGQSVKKIKK